MILTTAAMIALQTPGPAQAYQPRRVVASVLEAINTHYFDPQVAARITREVGDESRAGRFDDLAPPALAQRLTNQLSTYDRHFRVRYDAEAHHRPMRPDDAAGYGPETAGYGPEASDRRNGYGFRNVSILPGNIGYIQLNRFAPIDFDDAAWPARRSADAALAMVSRADSVIVDLRGNGGGDPGMVGYLVSAFVGPERDVYNVFHFGGQQRSERPPVAFPAPALEMPVYVLIDGRTGSAAEAFAYTLQAAGRASVVGETSAGAANPGGVMPLADGFSVFVSNATPINVLTGRNWEATGVVPDIATSPSAALDAARAAALREGLGRIAEAERIEVQWALDALTAEQEQRRHPAPEPLTGRYENLNVAVNDGALTIARPRSPAFHLGWLRDDLFYRVDDPAVRYEFRRGPDGRATTLIRHDLDGRTVEWSASHRDAD